MRFIILFSRTTSTTHPLTHRQLLRTLFDGTFKPVKDRGLDHAVEREKNLKPLLTLKNLLKLEPSKCLPVTIIKESLQLPFRPIEFTRKYPSIFQEFHLAGFQPHIKLTPETLDLDAEEQLMYQSDSFKHDVADRLLKLLMISKIHKLPLRVIEALRWDLGLPHDYVKSIVPEFPDYFRVVGTGNDAVLELVCWCSELAVSVLEKKGKRKGKGKGKGLEMEVELEFPVQFSTGFEMDKKYEKWLKEWKNLPYVSPYEDATYLPASSDESDRWVVGVLHEILNLLVSKKTEKDNVLMLGEWLGLASRFKRAMLQHPGIFYLSSKIGTYTVVLKDGYKRGLLIEDHRAMELRRKYIHLMNTVKEDGKTSKVVVKGKSGSKESSVKDSEGKSSTNESGVKDCEGKEGEENDDDDDDISGEDASEWSDNEAEDDDDNSETVIDDDDDDDEEKSLRGSHKTAATRSGRDFREMESSMKRPLRDSRRERSGGKFTKEPRKMELGMKRPLRDSRRERSGGKFTKETGEMELSMKRPLRDSRRERSGGKFTKETGEMELGMKRPLRDSHRERSGGRFTKETGEMELGMKRPLRDSRRERPGGKFTKETEDMELSMKRPLRDSRRERSGGRFTKKTEEKNPSEVFKRIGKRGGGKDVDSSQQSSRYSKSSRDVEGSHQRSRSSKMRGKVVD